MIITDVNIILAKNNERLLAYASITIDRVFVIKDIKIIKGNERTIVAMPDKQRSVACDSCDYKIRQRDKFCPHCGKELTFAPIEYIDICHPIENGFRHYIDMVIMEKYESMISAIGEPDETISVAANVPA